MQHSVDVIVKMDLHQEKKRKMNSSSASTVVPYEEGKYIEENVMIEILIRLPYKSISRFKCVSKLWLSLLSNPTFISRKLHDSSIPRWIFLYNFDIPLNIKYPDAYPNIYSSKKFRADNPGFLFKFLVPKLLLLQQGLPQSHHVKRQDDYNKSELFLLCGSNGLVLCENSDTIRSMFDTKVYLVGNPATGGWAHIPPPPLGRKDRRYKTGLICESSSPNSLNSKQTSYYKVVRIPFLGHSWSPVTKFDIELFSSVTGSWNVYTVLCPREVSTNNMKPEIRNPAIASRNEVLYWIVTDRINGQILLAYDLKQNSAGVRSHLCRLIELPERINYRDQRCLGTIGGFISNSHCSEGILKVWSLEDDIPTGLCKWHLTQNAYLKDMIFEEDCNQRNMSVTAPLALHPMDENVMFVVVGSSSVFMYNFETKLLKQLSRELSSNKSLPFVLIPSLETL